MADYAEVLLEAMDIISKKQIDAVSFDKTIEATIINTSKAADGIYTVAYGNSKFTAYSTETAYRENDVVMVTVPQGNFDNQKIIIGKKVDDMNTPLVYKSPFQQIINVTNNLIEEDVGIFGCWANGGTTLGLENDPGWNLDVLDFKDSNAHTKPQATQQNPDPKYYGLIWDSGDIFETQFTRLGLQAQFCTWLSEYNTTFGNYGLALQLTFKCVDIPDPPTENDPPNTFYKIVTFDSNGFFGDVYNFETYYTQETVFDLTEFTDYPIVNIQLFGYQRNNFFNADGEDIYQNEAFTPDFTGGFMTINPNIFIKDPYICLGIAAEDFITDTATLITPNPLTYQKYYDNTQPGQDDDWLYTQNKKQVQLRWIHKFEKEDVIKAVEDNEFPRDYEVRWYRYQLGAKSPDQFAGAHWTRFYGIHSAPSKKTGEWVITQEEIQGNADLDLATDNIFIDFEPNINWQEEQLKAIVLKIESSVGDHQIYRLIAVSNTLTFTNDDNVRSQATIIDSNALAIVYDDEEKGHYFLYNRAGNINENEDKEVRQLRAVFDRDVDNVYEKSDLNVEDCYSVIWTFPDINANTMIIPMDSSDKVTAKPAVPDANGQFIFTGVNTVGFTIKDHLNNNATQNTIKLEVILKGETFTAQVQPIFGTAGTSGSDYTIILVWENNENALNLSEQKSFEYKEKDSQNNLIQAQTPAQYPALSGKAYLYDQVGQLVDIQAEEAHYEFSWYRTYEPQIVNGLVKASNTMKYPVRKNGTLEALDIQDASDIPTYLIDDNNTQKYRYSLTEGEKGFVEDNNPPGLYYQAIGDNNLDAIEFQEIPITLCPDDDGYVYQYAGVIKGTGKQRTYYYSGIKRAFVKYNDTFIIDPWEEYSEVETYYEPIKTSERVYNSQHLTIINDQDPDNKGHVILYGNPDTKCLYILQVALKDFGDYDLVARFPIPLKNGELSAASEINSNTAQGQKLFVVDYIEGATDVRYATTGETDFNKNPYQITCRQYDINQGKFVTLRNGYSTDDNLHGVWGLIYDPPEDINASHTFLPSLEAVAASSNNTSPRYLLHPPGLYFKDTPLYGVMFILTSGINCGGGNQLTTGTVLWTQPIYSYQDNYPSTTLNKWNGKDIETDNDTGTIVANGFAAGKKERDNTFTGVVLGDWSRTDTDSFITKQTGVYGFNHGAMSYALKDDGTAFFGKDGRGRIYLSGNKAQIYSSEWLLAQEGMLLDIDDGYVKMIRNVHRGSLPYIFGDDSSFNVQVSIQTAVGNPIFYLQQYKPSVKTANGGNDIYWDTNGESSIYIPSSFTEILVPKNQSDVYRYRYDYVNGHFGKGAIDYLRTYKIVDENNGQCYFWYASVSVYAEDMDANAIQPSVINYSIESIKTNVVTQNNKNILILNDEENNNIEARTCLVKEEEFWEYEAANSISTTNNQSSWASSQKILHKKRKTYYFLLGYINDNVSDILFKNKEIILETIETDYAHGYTQTGLTDKPRITYVRAVNYQNISIDNNFPEQAPGFYFVPAISERDTQIYIFNMALEINYDSNQPYVSQDSLITNMPVDMEYYTNQGELKDKYITLSVAEKEWPLGIGTTKSIGSRKFRVNWEGQLYAEDGIFSGKITSHEGEIGGWIIAQDMLYSKYQGTPIRSETGWNGVILDAYDGSIYGANIYTKKGRIGGWWIKPDNLYGGNTMLHRSNGIITDVVKIKETATVVDQFGDATSWNYFGGMGYVSAQFSSIESNDLEPGVGVFYGLSASSSQAIYKVNAYNLGFKWFGPYMSINMKPPAGNSDPPQGTLEGAKYWRFGGNNQTAFYIQDMILFSVKLEDNEDNELSFEGNLTDKAFYFKSKPSGSNELDLATFKEKYIQLKGGDNTYIAVDNRDTSTKKGVFLYGDENNYLQLDKSTGAGNLHIQPSSGNATLNIEAESAQPQITISASGSGGTSSATFMGGSNNSTIALSGLDGITLTASNSSGSIGITAGNNIEMQTTNGNITLTSGNNATIEASGNADITASGDANIEASGAVEISGTDISTSGSTFTMGVPMTGQSGIFAQFG